MQNNNVLITGGHGFLGSYLTPHLEKEGQIVKTLSRKKNSSLAFSWDIENHELDPNVFNDIGTIIHLAGSGIAARRWTNTYKNEILNSRVNSANLLFDTLKSIKHNVRLLISASAIGIYGDSGDTWVAEDFHVTENFLGETCRKWEEAALQFEKIGIRVVILRIGLVLGKNGGVLPALALPVNFFAGAIPGSGKQYMSWIHINDLCSMFSFAMTNEKMHGPYNAVAPGPVTQKEFIQKIAVQLHRPVWPIHIPSFVMKMILGEKAAIVLEGQRVSSEKIRLAGFKYVHTDLNKVLSELLE